MYRWKAAPRKTHSNDITRMIRRILDDGEAGAGVILSIYRCSILGNYGHSGVRPPLPLRFRAYRMQREEEFSQVVSRHPFMLYALKECLVSSVINDFGLHRTLCRYPSWRNFEQRVIQCADRVLRPYAAVSEPISARLLLTHGKNATLSQAAICSSQKQASAYVKKAGCVPLRGVSTWCGPFFGIPRDTWLSCTSDIERADLVSREVLSCTGGVTVIPLPRQLGEKQRRSSDATRSGVYVCRLCHNGYFVGHNVGGKKREALGDALTGKWYCPQCDEGDATGELVCVPTIGQIVFCANGAHSCCIHCGRPTLFYSESVECSACREEQSEASVERQRVAAEKCWHVGCNRGCVTSFNVVPLEGVDDGGEWGRYFSCHVHAIPEHACELPIPAEDVRRVWHAWKGT